MSEPKKIEIAALNFNKDVKTGKKSVYMSFSNGMDVAGVYVASNTKKELLDFLKPSRSKKDE